MRIYNPHPSNEPPEITYLFIDGGYLRDKYKRATSRWFNNDVVDLRNIDFAAIKWHFKAKKFSIMTALMKFRIKMRRKNILKLVYLNKRMILITFVLWRDITLS
ncbi:hypothetical protein [Okeania sp. KiyG1]|uniref:hypothetical protein n=1 Tax=Okeania sp. KiyG1 TaxID=2720165 RepID=UPI001920D3A8|nr:hypothetical protein [Okeania sp. KiyG1]GGA00590.1 hypothetical protein CYANOKiyG1_12290 [Okeania sp. KiyG1]